MSHYPFPVHRSTVDHELAARLVALLIHESMWFEVEPEPDDKYTVTVRKGEEHRIHPLLQRREAPVDPSTLSHEALADLVTRIQMCLWQADRIEGASLVTCWDPNVEWGSDHLERIGALMTEAGLRPPEG